MPPRLKRGATPLLRRKVKPLSSSFRIKPGAAVIMSLIAKRFEKNEPPYTAAEISEEHQIPIRLTNQVLYQLQEIELIHEVVTDEKSEEIGYQPSMDINQLNVAVLLDRLDTYGSENFKIDKDEEFNDEWKVLTESREEYYKKASKVLLKDL